MIDPGSNVLAEMAGLLENGKLSRRGWAEAIWPEGEAVIWQSDHTLVDSSLIPLSPHANWTLVPKYPSRQDVPRYKAPSLIALALMNGDQAPWTRGVGGGTTSGG